jgi:hypothetical protein
VKVLHAAKRLDTIIVQIVDETPINLPFGAAPGEPIHSRVPECLRDLGLKADSRLSSRYVHVRRLAAALSIQ